MREDGDATYDALVCSGSICDVVSRAADGWWHASWGPFIAHLTGPRKRLLRLQNLLLTAILVIVNTYLYARVGHYRSEVTAERNELLIAKNHPTRSVALQQLAISPQPARASSFDFFLVNFAIVAFHTTKASIRIIKHGLPHLDTRGQQKGCSTVVFHSRTDILSQGHS